MLRKHHRPAAPALLATLAVALVAGCAQVPRFQPQGSPLATAHVASPNLDARRPNLVIIHHTSDDTAEQALATLTSPLRKVSAHYLIGRDGRIVQLVDEGDRAWHAGVSWWGGITDVNSVSLGIELDNNGHEPFAEAQIAALLTLLADLRDRHRIPRANFVGHADVAPGRKDDPSDYFPWDRLAAAGFGLWCSPPLPPAPAGFDLPTALVALGYDPRRPAAARAAFRLHYVRAAAATAADEAAIAQCLLAQRAAGN